MSAIVIYPAAFRDEMSLRRRQDLDAAPEVMQDSACHQTDAMPSVLEFPAPGIASADGLDPDPMSSPALPSVRAIHVVERVRTSVGESLDALASAHRELSAVETCQDELARQASDMVKVSRDLGHQMSQLMAEARRMVASLRSDL